MKKKPKVRRVMLSYKKSCHISMVIKTVWHIGGGAHRAPWSTTVNSEKDAHNPQVNWCLIRLQKQFNGGKVAFQQMWAQLDVRPQVTNTKPQPQILNKDYFKVDRSQVWILIEVPCFIWRGPFNQNALIVLIHIFCKQMLSLFRNHLIHFFIHSTVFEHLLCFTLPLSSSGLHWWRK